MKINNVTKILPLLNWSEEGDFYHVQVIARKKDNPDLGKNARHLYHFYIESEKHLVKMFPEMVMLTEFHNARLMINLNKRNYKKLALRTVKKIIEQIENGAEKHIRNALHSVVGTYASDPDKTWIVDIDNDDSSFKQLDGTFDEFVNNTINDIIACRGSEKSRMVQLIPTHNGVHLITRPFDIKEFGTNSWRCAQVDIHKDNPTLLYSNIQ